MTAGISAAFSPSLFKAADRRLCASGLTLTLRGHAAFLLLIGVIVVAWRRFSAAVARGDLAVSCLAGVRFAVLFVYLVDDIVGATFVRLAVLGQVGYRIPNSSETLVGIGNQTILAVLIVGGLLVIWRLWQATRSPGP